MSEEQAQAVGGGRLDIEAIEARYQMDVVQGRAGRGSISFWDYNGKKWSKSSANDIPALIAEVRSLRDQREYFIAAKSEVIEELGQAENALREARAELEAAKGVIKAASAVMVGCEHVDGGQPLRNGQAWLIRNLRDTVLGYREAKQQPATSEQEAGQAVEGEE